MTVVKGRAMTYARCTTFDPRDGDECGAELEPMDEGGWRCPSCGVLDPTDGARCDDCGALEDWSWGPNPVCHRCLDQTDEAPLAIAYAFEGQIKLHAYAGSRSGQEVTIVTATEALILGASLINYAIAGDPRLALAAHAAYGETDWSRKLQASGTKLA
jgi:hypothetical protein